jgi:hypothetical protein
MPILILIVFELRAQAPPPPSLIWALTLTVWFSLWSSFNEWIREAEYEANYPGLKYEPFNDSWRAIDEIMTVIALVGIAERRASYQIFLSRLDGYISWEWAQEWFYEE